MQDEDDRTDDEDEDEDDEGFEERSQRPTPRGAQSSGRAGRGAAPPRAKEQRGTKSSIGPFSQPPPPESEIRRRVSVLDKLVTNDCLERCRAECEIGMLYLVSQPHRDKSNLPLDEWVDKNFGMPYQRLRHYVRLAGMWGQFEAAHQWYTSEGKRAGWRTVSATGSPYAIEVTKLHSRHKKGEAPGDRGKTEPDDSKRDRPPTLRQQLDEAMARIDEQQQQVSDLKHARLQADSDREWVEQDTRRWRRRAERAEAKLREHGIEFDPDFDPDDTINESRDDD